jgi:hypothetical protein
VEAHETRADAEFRGPPVTLEVRYGCDAVGMHLATLVDRGIFAGYETFIREVKLDLVRLIGAGIVVERPAATLTVYEPWSSCLFGRNRAIRHASRCSRQSLGSIRSLASGNLRGDGCDQHCVRQPASPAPCHRGGNLPMLIIHPSLLPVH